MPGNSPAEHHLAGPDGCKSTYDDRPWTDSGLSAQSKHGVYVGAKEPV